MYPMENGIIAVLLLAAIVVVSLRLRSRGPTRMGRSLYTIAAVLLGIWLVGVLVSVVTTPASP